MKKANLFIVIMFLFSNSYAQISGKSEDIVIGKKFVFHSEILDTDAELAVYLPPDYEKSTGRYPVLYILRDNFQIASAAVTTLSGHRQIPEMIIVDYTNNRMNEVPTKVEGNESMTGGAPGLIRFFREELGPYIESEYRTLPYRIFFSGSWGGLFCVYAMMTEPGYFHAALASGPWLIYDGGEKYMLKNIPEFLRNNTFRGNYLFFSGGAQPELTPSLEEMEDILKQEAPGGLRWEYDPMPNDDHGSIQYKTVFDGLRALYEPWNTIPEDIAEKGVGAIREYAGNIKNMFGYDLKISSFAVLNVGRNLMMNNRFEDSIAIFRLHLELYSDQPIEQHRAYFMIGRSYDQLGEYNKAVENYEKALIIKDKTGTSSFLYYKDYLENARKKIKK